MPFVPHIVGDDDEMDEVNETLEPEPTSNERSPFVDSSEMDTSDSSDSSDDSDSSSDGDSDVGHANAPANNVEQKKDRKEIVFKNQKDADKEDTDDSDDDDDDDNDDDDAMQVSNSNDITSIVGNAPEKGIENVVNETENADVAALPIPVVENLPKFKSIFDIPDPDDDDLCEIVPNNELRHEPVEINEITPSIESLPNIWLSNNTELASMQSPNRANSELASMQSPNLTNSDAMNEVGVPSPEKMQQDLGPEPLQPIATVDLEPMPSQPIATVDVEAVPLKPIATVDLEPMDIEKENIEPEIISLESDMDEEQEMEELESPNKRAKPKPKATVKQNIIDPDEWLSAESRRMSLRSANKPSPIATAASTERQRPTRPKPKANKVTKAKCVGPLGKHSASEAKMARPVVVTDYFRQVSATLVKNRVSLLPFLQLQKCVDELVTGAIKKTKINNDSSPNF